MKPVALFPVALILMLGSADEVETSQQEVGDFNITRAVSNYKDFDFQVEWEPEKLKHGQFEIYDIVVAVKHGQRKHLSPEGYIEVWDGKQFIFSCSVPQATKNSLRLTMKKKVETENAMLFFFRVNPRYITDSWFNYQVLRDDGSVEMNCLVRLKDFVGGVPAEGHNPTMRDQP